MEAIQNLYRAESDLAPIAAILVGYVLFAAVLLSQLV
jgi:hypothetical protein